MYEATTRYVPAGTYNTVYSPFSSVAAPRSVPSTITSAPIRGSPVSLSVTLPDIRPYSEAKSSAPIKSKQASLFIEHLLVQPELPTFVRQILFPVVANNNRLLK